MMLGGGNWAVTPVRAQNQIRVYNPAVSTQYFWLTPKDARMMIVALTQALGMLGVAADLGTEDRE